MEIARVYLDVSMINSFDGLRSIMRKSKVDPDTLPSGKFTIFINKKRTAFKLLVGTRHMVYHNNGGKAFPLEAIQNFPEFFDGRNVNLAAAVEKTIRQKLGLTLPSKISVPARKKYREQTAHMTA